MDKNSEKEIEEANELAKMKERSKKFFESPGSHDIFKARLSESLKQIEERFRITSCVDPEILSKRFTN